MVYGVGRGKGKRNWKKKKFFFWLLTLLLGFSLAGQEKPTWECPESNPIALLCNHCLLETKETAEVEAEEEEEEQVKPVKKEAKKEVEEEPEDKREHLNIIFIGHVGKNFLTTLFFLLF